MKRNELAARYNKIALALKGDTITLATCCGAPAVYGVNTRGFTAWRLCADCTPWRPSGIGIDDLYEIDQYPCLRDNTYTALLDAVREIEATKTTKNENEVTR